MESGLEGRNNHGRHLQQSRVPRRLNGVRPRRPEQLAIALFGVPWLWRVSMESGLEGRNNPCPTCRHFPTSDSLNGVRPRRPEQSPKSASVFCVFTLSQWSPA